MNKLSYYSRHLENAMHRISTFFYRWPLYRSYVSLLFPAAVAQDAFCRFPVTMKGEG